MSKGENYSSVQENEKSKSSSLLQPGGFLSSQLTLCSSMIGVGFLTLTEIGKENGLYPMIAVIVLTGLISVFANWQLGRGFRASGGKTYSKIVARVDGRTSSLVTMIFLFLYVYVSAGAYYVFGTQFGLNVVQGLKIDISWLGGKEEFENYFILVFFVICFLGSLPSKISALRYFTFITAIINLFLGGVRI